MKSLPVERFLDWAREQGLGLDPRYPESAVLGFTGGGGEARFWSVPPEPQLRPYFLRTLVRLMVDWESCFAWRRMGAWPDASAMDSERINDAVECRILAGLGLPLGSADVVELERTELVALVTLLFSTTVFGWSVGEDLYLVPDHARCVLLTDHHDVVHVQCRHPEDMGRWIAGMEAEEYPLPERLADSTFKDPGWMRRQDR